MINTVMKALYTGSLRILFALLCAMAFLARDAAAADVSWEILPDRENVTVTLTPEEGFAGRVSRVSPRGLLLDLGVPTAGMGRSPAPDNARFFEMSEPRGRALGFFMKTDAFTYVVTRPARNVVIIGAFHAPRESALLAPGPSSPAGVDPGPDQAAPSAPGAPAEAEGGAPPPAPRPGLEETGPAASSPAEPTGIPGIVRGRVDAASPAGAATAPADLPVASGGSAQVDPGPHGAATSGGTEFRSRINPGGVAEWLAMHPQTASPAGGDRPAPQPQPAEAPPAATPEATPAATPGTTPASRGVQADFPHPAASGQPAQTAPAPAEPSRGEPQAGGGDGAPARRTYTDEKGNVIEVPDPSETLGAIRGDLLRAAYKDALDKLDSLQVLPDLTREQKGDALHLRAEALFLMHQDDFVKNFDVVVSATIAAMNYDVNDPRNAVCYLRLGYINLKVGNLVEAEAYINQLRRLYPDDENVPLTYYYWGEYYYGQNDMQKAADQFQYIIGNYSESKFARDAALGLARSYMALGYYQEAFDIVDYIERRWPRLYMENPAVLELMGDAAFRLGKLDFALDKYMTYYNLVPDGPSADVILTRIGDVYARKRQLAAAKSAYEEAERRFPDRDGGLVAMMRLAEVGINDAPAIPDMFSIFQGPATLRPVQIYTKIINEHPDSQLVPLAQLKLAMWHLWRKEYEKSLEIATSLVTQHPKHELVPRAEEVAMSAFTALAAESASQDRPGLIVENWSRNPVIRRLEEELPPQSRVALAASMWKQNDPDGALRLVNPLFLGTKVPTYSEQALQLALAIDLEHDQWQAIEKLNDQIALWELTGAAKKQLDYAVALARENLGKSEEAAPVWKRLAEGGGLTGREQAYVEYFLAKHAESARQLHEAYLFGRNSLNRFLQLAREEPGAADTGKIMSLLSSLMDVTETSGRFDEALEYARQYLGQLTPDDPQRQGLLFRIANIYKKQGNLEEWRKTLQEIVDTYPDTVHGRAAASTLRSANLADEAARFSPNGQL